MENLTPFKRLLQKMRGTILYSWVLFSKIIQPSVRIYFSVEGDSGQVAKMEVEQLVGHSQWSGEPIKRTSVCNQHKVPHT